MAWLTSWLVVWYHLNQANRVYVANQAEKNSKIYRVRFSAEIHRFVGRIALCKWRSGGAAL